MNGRNAAAWVAAFAVLVLLAFRVIDTDGGSTSAGGGNQSTQNDGAASKSREAKVLRVVDGDTILVRRSSSGQTERVRYIGVDTPESVKPDTPVQCYGHEASNYNKSLVGGKTVRLVPDREPYDKYGRSLAFVYVGNTLINAELVRNGYARTLEIPPNTSRAGQFAGLERVAIRTSRGLWGRCDR